jgi:hypothetical protein
MPYTLGMVNTHVVRTYVGDAATTGVCAVVDNSVSVVGLCGKAGEGAHQAVGKQGTEDGLGGGGVVMTTSRARHSVLLSAVCTIGVRP